MSRLVQQKKTFLFCLTTAGKISSHTFSLFLVSHSVGGRSHKKNYLLLGLLLIVGHEHHCRRRRCCCSGSENEVTLAMSSSSFPSHHHHHPAIPPNTAWNQHNSLAREKEKVLCCLTARKKSLESVLKLNHNLSYFSTSLPPGGCLRGTSIELRLWPWKFTFIYFTFFEGLL